MISLELGASRCRNQYRLATGQFSTQFIEDCYCNRQSPCGRTRPRL